MWIYPLRIFSFLMGVASLQVAAGDLSSDIRKGAAGPDTGNGGYFEVGLGLASYTSPFYGMPEGNEKGEVHTELAVDVSARYQYQGWFVELFSQSLQQFTLGYNAYADEHWAFDVVGSFEHNEISEDINKEYRGLKTREQDFLVGPRATAYFGNTILQVHALFDASNTHYGELYSIKLARYWQKRNWNFHAILGATYRSEQIVDYYISIDEDEASDKFPQFDASAGMVYVAEIGTTYPINERWVFRSFIRRLELDSDALGSPLVLDDHGEIFVTSINYVF